MIGDNLKFRLETALPEEYVRAIKSICKVYGIRPSVYLRQLVARDLIALGMIERPTLEINGQARMTSHETDISAPK